ncbi:MAG: hypothetical protein H5T33_05120, partial [Candidatus Methanosuratus sp.]|nr:hypothetical protein [Candidatus Methanosuratincola sp.]
GGVRPSVDTEKTLFSIAWAMQMVDAAFGTLFGAMVGLFGASSTQLLLDRTSWVLPAAMIVGAAAFASLFNAISGLVGILCYGRSFWRNLFPFWHKPRRSIFGAIFL